MLRLAFAAIFITSFSAKVHGAEFFNLIPVKLIGYAGKDLRISATIPCGAKWYGLSVTETKTTLKLAGVIKRSAIVCAHLGRSFEVRINYLATTSFKTITTLDPKKVSGRLSISPVKELRLSKQSLRAVYSPRCGNTLGSIVRQANENTLHVGLLETNAKKSCELPQQLRAIRAIDLSRPKSIRNLADESGSIERQYRLRVAPMTKGTKQGQGLSVRFQHRCNESPVGIVVTPAKQGKSGVGVLLAQYFNRPCSTPEPNRTSTYIVDEVDLGKNRQIRPFNADISLALRQPVDITKMKKVGAKIKVDYSATCQKTLGTVFGNDYKGRLAVGLLTQETSTACGKNPSKRRWTQTVFDPKLKVKDLAPMQLVGTLTP